MNIYQKLGVATAAVALSGAIVEAKPTQAAILTYSYKSFDPNFEFTQVPQDEIFGTFQYDDTKEVNNGLVVFPLTDFTLNWVDASNNLLASFTGADFVEKPSAVELSSGEFLSLRGDVSGEAGNLSTSGSFTIPNITFSGFGGNLVGPDGQVGVCRFCQLTYTFESRSVPEHGTGVWLGVLGLVGLSLKKKVAS